MGRIGVYIERYTITRSEEMEALMRFSQVARRLGHEVDYLFRPDMHKIKNYDAIFIRALTDPLNSAFVASRTAEMHGVRVIDDSRSIYICCDKVNMYRHLMQAGVPIPDTRFLEENDLSVTKADELFEQLGQPMVLKAPNSSFSMYVDRVSTPEEYVKVGNRFLRRADRLVAQRFVSSDFDWRVGMLGGKVIYVCQYGMPRKQWKILAYSETGRQIYGPVKSIEVERADPKLLKVASAAANAVGRGLYGVDLKQIGDEFIVIEVNDNPTIGAGEEDKKSPRLYEDLVKYLMNES